MVYGCLVPNPSFGHHHQSVSSSGQSLLSSRSSFVPLKEIIREYVRIKGGYSYHAEGNVAFEKRLVEETKTHPSPPLCIVRLSTIWKKDQLVERLFAHLHPEVNAPVTLPSLNRAGPRSSSNHHASNNDVDVDSSSSEAEEQGNIPMSRSAAASSIITASGANNNMAAQPPVADDSRIRAIIREELLAARPTQVDQIALPQSQLSPASLVMPFNSVPSQQPATYPPVLQAAATPTVNQHASLMAYQGNSAFCNNITSSITTSLPPISAKI